MFIDSVGGNKKPIYRYTNQANIIINVNQLRLKIISKSVKTKDNFYHIYASTLV